MLDSVMRPPDADSGRVADGHIFISYARPDSAYVRRLVEFLRSRGIEVWVDEEIGSGQRWELTLREKIDTCVALVAVMSPDAERSEWVTAELQRGRDQRKPVFPLLLEGGVFFSLGHLQYVDVTDGGLPGESFVAQLAEAVRRPAAAVSRPAPGPAIKVPWMAKPVAPSTVDRPELTDRIVAALLTDAAATVGVTGLYGGGGFGKTTVARLVCQHPAIRARFVGGVIWAEIGQDRHGADLTTLIADLCQQLSHQRPDFANPDQAGYHLGGLLAQRPPTLLVIDDLWDAGQLAPFLHGEAVTRLVTTRIANLLSGEAVAVQVDGMDDAQARQLLTGGLPPLPESLVARLLDLTGGWALPTAMANGVLRRGLRQGRDPVATGAFLADRLADQGPASLDLGNTHSREKTITATVQSSLGLLSPHGQERFGELAIFPEDTDIPVSVVALLWSGGGVASPVQVEALCEELAELSLFADYRPGQAIRLHDVIRSYARHQLGADRLRSANAAFLRAAAARLAAPEPQSEPGSEPQPEPRSDLAGPEWSRPWWTMPPGDDYLWRNIGHHLADAGLDRELTALVLDLRWIERKTGRYGVADVEVDLARSLDPLAGALRRALVREAHLLGPVVPEHSHVDILASRLEPVEQLEPLLARLRAVRPAGVRRLTNAWPLPDSNPDTIRVLSGHIGSVRSVAIAPDGAWLVTTGRDGTVRTWDAATGAQRASLTGHSGTVRAVAIARDGTWFATAGSDQSARIWDGATGEQRAVLRGHRGRVNGAVAISPDGSWLVTTGGDATVRIWDAATGQQQAMVRGHRGRAYGVAIAPDGTWFATTGSDATVRIWDAATHMERAVLIGHDDRVNAVAIAGDGTWLASASDDKTVRIWDAATAAPGAVLTGHTNGVNGVAIAADGNWLATGGNDATVRIWDRAAGTLRAVLYGHTSWATGVAIAASGTWLATSGNDPTVRIWDAASSLTRGTLRGDTHWVNGLAIAADGGWLASTGNDKRLRIREAATGATRVILAGHTSRANGVAIARDGTWIVTGGDDRTARVWDAATGDTRAVLTGHTSRVSDVAIDPDGRWLVTTSDDHTARVWDALSGETTTVYTGHANRVNAVAVSPDGSWLVTTSDDLTARIWDPATGVTRGVLGPHTGAVYGVAIAPDGRWLATGGDDGVVRIWDVTTHTLRSVLKGHTRRVRAVAIAADGRWLASTGADRLVLVWDLTTIGAGAPDPAVPAAAPATAEAAMRVDAALSAVCWRPDGSGLFLSGNRGVYAFDLT